MLNFLRGLFRPKPYETQRQTLDVNTLESNSPKLIVSQNGYGVSRPKAEGGKKRAESTKRAGRADSTPPHLLTSIGGCLMIHFPGTQKGVNVLAHLDPHIDNLTALYRAMSHLVNAGILDHPRGSKASIMATPATVPNAIERAAL